jgi:hypothetical protein
MFTKHVQQIGIVNWLLNHQNLTSRKNTLDNIAVSEQVYDTLILLKKMERLK